LTTKKINSAPDAQFQVQRKDQFELKKTNPSIKRSKDQKKDQIKDQSAKKKINLTSTRPKKDQIKDQLFGALTDQPNQRSIGLVFFTRRGNKRSIGLIFLRTLVTQRPNPMILLSSSAHQPSGQVGLPSRLGHQCVLGRLGLVGQHRWPSRLG